MIFQLSLRRAGAGGPASGSVQLEATLRLRLGTELPVPVRLSGWLQGKLFHRRTALLWTESDRALFRPGPGVH